MERLSTAAPSSHNAFDTAGSSEMNYRVNDDQQSEEILTEYVWVVSTPESTGHLNMLEFLVGALENHNTLGVTRGDGGGGRGKGKHYIFEDERRRE